MRQLILLLSITSIMAFSNCQSTKKAVQNLPESVLQDHASAAFPFQEGAYYSYNFGEGPHYNFDEKEILNRLIAAKLIPSDAWYKAASSSCSPPGSDLAMTVMVDPVLLLRFDKPQANLNEFGFAVAEKPSAGDCAYYVRHYKFGK